MRIEPASAADLTAIESLLERVGLPLDGAREAFGDHGVVARDAGVIVGAAAVEIFGRDALLRSVAVDPAARGAGTGAALVGAAESVAREAGVSVLWLLTETAGGWFPRLGYRVADRTLAPPNLAESVEFTTACSASAVLMRKPLASG